MAFPNKYAIGITSLGYQIIWATLAQRKDVDVRRLFTDQSDIPHRSNDLFGISLSWELDGPVLLDLLEKNKIPIWSNERSDQDPIVFGGGQVLTANPEPFAPFLDVVLLGDGENLMPTFINKMNTIKDLSRFNKLKELAQIPGIYIPIFYQPQYDNNGKLLTIKPITHEIPETITKQTWKQNTLSHSTVITPDAAWPNIHMVEVVRSCPELCRFCLASYLNLPFRTSSVEGSLIPAIEKGFAITKRIGLLGASVTQHPEFEELIDWLNNDHFNDMRLSLSSVRATTVNPKLTKLLSRRNSKSITIAIESGSEKIRDIINKKITEEEILTAAKYAKEGGLKGLKLYGMVGLPQENEDDIEATIKLLIKLKDQNPGLRITFGVSTFVPKAHTPFQWFGVRAEAKNRLKKLTKYLKPKGIQFRPESYGWSIIQALISRSDRRLAQVIPLVRGSHNSLGGWKQAYKIIQEKNTNSKSKEQLPSWEDVIHSQWDHEQVLPWAHLLGPLQSKQLINHQKKALEL
nr:radical SAM protein [Prochlorococcus marinus]